MENHHNKKTAQDKPRRRILKMIWMGLGFIALVEFMGVCLTFFRPKKNPASAKDTDQIIDAGHVSEIKPDSVTTFVRGRFYLVRVAKGGFLAISSKCPHLGCTVPWDKPHHRFICPCHSSQFDITGRVVSSPAPRAMDIFKIEITNNRIFVNTGQITRRNSFSEEQLVYPDLIKIKTHENG